MVCNDNVFKIENILLNINRSRKKSEQMVFQAVTIKTSVITLLVEYLKASVPLDAKCIVSVLSVCVPNYIYGMK